MSDLVKPLVVIYGLVGAAFVVAGVLRPGSVWQWGLGSAWAVTALYWGRTYLAAKSRSET